MARSQCYLQLGDAEKALKDAEETLVDDKNYIKVNENRSIEVLDWNLQRLAKLILELGDIISWLHCVTFLIEFIIIIKIRCLCN